MTTDYCIFCHSELQELPSIGLWCKHHNNAIVFYQNVLVNYHIKSYPIALSRISIIQGPYGFLLNHDHFNYEKSTTMLVKYKNIIDERENGFFYLQHRLATILTNKDLRRIINKQYDYATSNVIIKVPSILSITPDNFNQYLTKMKKLTAFL